MNKIILLFIAIYFSSCIQVISPFSQLPPGIWRAELAISNEVTLPFTFSIEYDENDQIKMIIHNAEENIELSEITFGKNKKLQDTFYVNLPLLDSYITALYRENVLEGEWVVRNRDDYHIPFVAHFGQDRRFEMGHESAKVDLTGKWEATFEIETEDEYPAIGEFVQKGNQLMGTFRTETGDYRYLEGEIRGDHFQMSCFDGGHAFLFTGTVIGDDQLIGKFYSGKHYETNWIAIKNEDAQLTDPFHLSDMRHPENKLSFSYPNAEGRLISLDDEKYKGKVKIITIMGTWCPNCLDEARFLMDYLKKNQDMDIEVISLAFEKYRDKNKAIQTLKRYKDRLGFTYEILYAGYYDKKEATENLGFLDEIISYPTILFVDRNNYVDKVHTGYNGPATSEYASFVQEFDAEIKKLLLN